MHNLPAECKEQDTAVESTGASTKTRKLRPGIAPPPYPWDEATIKKFRNPFKFWTSKPCTGKLLVTKFNSIPFKHDFYGISCSSAVVLRLIITCCRLSYDKWPIHTVRLIDTVCLIEVSIKYTFHFIEKYHGKVLKFMTLWHSCQSTLDGVFLIQVSMYSVIKITHSHS